VQAKKKAPAADATGAFFGRLNLDYFTTEKRPVSVTCGVSTR
jgi:hypothetical protein